MPHIDGRPEHEKTAGAHSKFVQRAAPVHFHRKSESIEGQLTFLSLGFLRPRFTSDALDGRVAADGQTQRATPQIRQRSPEPIAFVSDIPLVRASAADCGDRSGGAHAGLVRAYSCHLARIGRFRRSESLPLPRALLLQRRAMQARPPRRDRLGRKTVFLALTHMRIPALKSAGRAILGIAKGLLRNQSMIDRSPARPRSIGCGPLSTYTTTVSRCVYRNQIVSILSLHPPSAIRHASQPRSTCTDRFG